MKKPLKKTSNSFLSSPTISNEEKVEILNEKLKFIINSSRYLNQDPDINDYYLQSNLEEINMNSIMVFSKASKNSVRLQINILLFIFYERIYKIIKKTS